MKVITERIDEIDEELNGAMDYAERYVVFKETHPQWASMYHEMALQEVSHANNLREIAQDAMDTMAYIPQDDDDRWKAKQKHHSEKKAMIKLLLSK